jgi:predicted dehydrogenase
MPELVVGVIGYQNHSYKIISTLSKNKSIKKIYSFCYKKEKIKYLNKNNKIKILEYVSDLKELNQCKSVFISSATKTHFEYIRKFIKKKIYIYCEKPGPTDLKQINFLKKLPKKIKERIYFGHNLLHSDVYNVLNKAIKKKTYGKPIYAQVSITNGISYKKSFNNNWRLKSNSEFQKISGNVGIHYLSFFMFLFGEIKNIKINQFGCVKKNKIDNAIIDMNFNKNFYSKIFLSYSTIAQEEIKIFFSNALLVANEKNLSIFYPRNTFNKMGNFIKPKRKIIKKFTNSWSEKSLQNSINYFIKVSSYNKNFKKEDFNKFLKVNEIIAKN